MSSEKFESNIIVTKQAIDEMNHVNNVMYLQWVQDIAKKHWITKTDQQIRDTYVWVVMNHYISYHYPAFENEELTLQTWIDHYHGAKCERHTNIINTSSKKVIVSAKTMWCLLYKETLRPVRINEEISTLFL